MNKQIVSKEDKMKCNVCGKETATELVNGTCVDCVNDAFREASEKEQEHDGSVQSS